LEAGADDYRQSDDVWEITCEPAAYEPLRAALTAAGITPQSSELSMVPSNTVPVDAGAGRKVLNLVEALEEHEDIQNVYSNFELPDDVLASLGQG
ncbi:MAG: YebC/PmpR family DNA-binding transcriptional regulator, partial [Planctomycetes bacterium]|nr:YebC/PmpR family DNA-binding transcriptional regulator [Planctomycetota bacterium]